MADPIFQLLSRPGIKRDGTVLDGDNYQDGQWVRFQRGRPKKMGGYRSMSTLLSGPLRAVLIDARQTTNTAHAFSPWGVQRLQFDDNGSGGAIYDRTPAGFTPSSDFLWQADKMWAAGGSNFTAMICAATPDASSIASDVAGGLYYGDITGTAALAAVADGSGPITVSGGCVVLQPFLFIYGSNGLIRNSNVNDISATTGWAVGGSNYSSTANVAGTKIVRGLPMRGGSAAPAGLFWALDALIRVTFAGGTKIWQYDTLSSQTSVLSKNGIIEYDGVYYWAGLDRFFMYNGVVQEIPNQMNLNWFFDNLNFNARQKVWCTKVPRYGEIWWFYPRGVATECTHAVILNVRENLWYDVALPRSAGFQTQLFPYPIWGGGENSTSSMYFTFTQVTGAFNINDVITGVSSGTVGQVLRIIGSGINVMITSGSAFSNGETIQTAGAASTGTVTSAQQPQELDTLWQHEFGHDRIVGQEVSAIYSFFETTNLSLPTGGPTGDQAGLDAQTRVIRIEPDAIQLGSMDVRVNGHSYANDPVTVSDPYPFDPTTPYVTLREQFRELSLQFESNTVGGHYELGKILVKYGQGDERG